MSLLPSRGPETSTRQEGEFEVVGVDEDVAPVLDALASDTARDVLNAIYANPGTPSEIAGRLDMSIQKVAYHLEKLEDVDLIAVAGTRYSEKGQEMTVYEPPDDPLVLFVGTEERKSRLRSLVRRVVPTVAALGLGSLLVQRLFGRAGSLLPIGGPTGNGGDGGGSGGDYSISSGGDEQFSAQGEAATSTPVATDGGQSSTVEAMETTPATPQPSATSQPAATSTPDPTTVDTTSSTNLATDSVDLVAQTADPGIEPGLAFFLGGLFALTVVGVWLYYRDPGR